MSASSSRAGISFPGVMGCFSATASESAAARAAASAPAVSPDASRSQAPSARCLIPATRLQ